MAVAHQPARHVGAHPTEPDDPQLHAPNPMLATRVAWPTDERWQTNGQAATTPSAADVLTIFGITGDLAKKMTFRALYRLEARGKLDCPIVGVAIDDWDVEQLREHAREAIASTVGGPRRGRLRPPRRADLLRPGRLRRRRHLRAGRRRRSATPKQPVFYLEIPPSLFATVVDGPRRGRPGRQRAGGDREAVRPRPRVGAGAQRRAAARCCARTRSCASTTTSARSR